MRYREVGKQFIQSLDTAQAAVISFQFSLGFMPPERIGFDIEVISG